MSKKSLSPLIATFILISLTVAVGAMIVAWGRGYVERQMECLKLGASFSIISRDFNSMPWKITLRLYNTGEAIIRKEDVLFKIFAIDNSWEDCFHQVGRCTISNLDNINPKEYKDVTLNIYDTSSVYNKNIFKIDLYHKTCNHLLYSLTV